MIKKKVCTTLWKLTTLLEIKTKENIVDIRIQSVTMVKTCFEFNTKKGIEAKKKKKMEAKLKKRCYQLMSNALYGKTMENVRNRADTKPLSKKKKAI